VAATEAPALYLVAGARPNFVKLAPVAKALKRQGDLTFSVVHTGQHYDAALSDSFFDVLDIDPPEINLDVGSGTHGLQTALILERFERLLLERPPAAVVVFGDVNSTLAGALAAAKLEIPVAHVEAGLRSFDRGMPEEVNRIVADSISDLLLVSEPSGVRNLKTEGRADDAIREVGNVMIDSLRSVEPAVASLRPWERYGFVPHAYGFVTMHRPSNVDDPKTLRRLFECLERISVETPLVFSVHPRTGARLQALRLTPTAGLRLCGPVNYLESVALQRSAAVVLTDSGGIQEEASCLDVPCLTLRWNTERPVTVQRGSSTLVGNDPDRILAAYGAVREGRYKRARPIPRWDGHAALRVAGALADWLDAYRGAPGRREPAGRERGRARDGVHPPAQRRAASARS
jgi:UDP-N-acetylglucosamine 2-epimerase (non-hydrolysing)